MNKVVLLILAGTLALLTESCSYFSDFAKARKELEEETVKPIPVQVNSAKSEPETTKEQLFGDLEEEQEPVQAVVGLIPATNPDVRVRGSVRGRNDPFSVVTLNPRIEIEQKEKEEVVKSPPNRSQRFQNQPTQQANDDRPNFVADLTDRPNSVADLPEPPAVEPTLARDVVISGLYEANGRTSIIVQAPEESNSRYVEVGQYLSNGQVLVKSIDEDRFPTPMIILEQAGVEVPKTIGESLQEEISSLPLETPSNQTWVSSISLN